MAVNYPQLILDMYNAANPNLPTKATLEWISVADQVGQLQPTEANGHRNTTINLSAIETDEDNGNPFRSFIVCNYTRPEANMTGDTITVDQDKWSDDAFVLEKMNELLKETYPDDEFPEGSLIIERGPSQTADGDQSVFVTWNHLKFAPPQGDVLLEFVLMSAKSDLSTANGELDNFS